MPQITPAKVQRLNQQWSAVLNKYRGAAPVGLAVAHMVAETNGNTTPTVRDFQRSIGIMKIPFRVGRKYGYTETQLEDPIRSIYVWGLKTNADSQRLHRQISDGWTTANYDFWLSTRLIFTLGFASYEKLLAKAVTTTSQAVNAITARIQTWIRTEMPAPQRFGKFNARDLRRIADELDQFQKTMTTLDGSNKTSTLFTMAPTITPGGLLEAVRTARVRSAS